MLSSDAELAPRLHGVRHPGGLGLREAALRLGVTEGRVAEILSVSGPVLPGGIVRSVRLRPRGWDRYRD